MRYSRLAVFAVFADEPALKLVSIHEPQFSACNVHSLGTVSKLALPMQSGVHVWRKGRAARARTECCGACTMSAGKRCSNE